MSGNCFRLARRNVIAETFVHLEFPECSRCHRLRRDHGWKAGQESIWESGQKMREEIATIEKYKDAYQMLVRN